MTNDDRINKDSKTTGSGGSLAAGIAIGAVVGATAVALTDKKNQAKVKSTVKKVKKWADRTSGHVSEKSHEIMKESRADLEGIRKEIKDPKES